MKTILSLATIALLPFAGATAQQQLPQVKVDVKQARLEQQMTPQFTVIGVTEKRFKPKNWLEIDAELDVRIAKDSGGRDALWPELQVKFYVGTNAKSKDGKDIVLSGTMSYLNASGKDPSHILAYISPSALQRALQKENGGKSDVVAFGFEVLAGGQIVGGYTSGGGQWWVDASKQPDPKKEFHDGAVLPKIKTPFAPLWGDYDLEAKP